MRVCTSDIRLALPRRRNSYPFLQFGFGLWEAGITVDGTGEDGTA
jgi:hypothetical protein